MGTAPTHADEIHPSISPKHPKTRAGELEQVRSALEAVGQWKHFCHRRDALVKVEGMTPEDARDRALLEFESIITAAKAGIGVRPRPDDVPRQRKRSAQKREQAAQKRPSFKSKEEFQDFAAKEAPVVEQIRWVAKHLEVNKSWWDPTTAPCAEAWAMLKNYARSDDRKDEFWDKMYSRIVPTRAQLENEDSGLVDGQHIRDTIAQQREFLARTKTKSAKAGLYAS
jgi:hypothetical protein